MNFSVILLVLCVVFIAELPDKSMFASLALSTHFRKTYVWIGAAAAFLVHVIIAVTAGHFLTLLPKRPLEIIVGILFLFGAVILVLRKDEDESDKKSKPTYKTNKKLPGTFLGVFATSFTVVFLGEWGDITQIVTANYAAKYHQIWSVGIGAVLGLWLVAALGIFIGSTLLEHVPARFVRRGTAVILLLFAGISLWSGLR